MKYDFNLLTPTGKKIIVALENGYFNNEFLSEKLTLEEKYELLSGSTGLPNKVLFDIATIIKRDNLNFLSEQEFCARLSDYYYVSSLFRFGKIYHSRNVLKNMIVEKVNPDNIVGFIYNFPDNCLSVAEVRYLISLVNSVYEPSVPGLGSLKMFIANLSGDLNFVLDKIDEFGKDDRRLYDIIEDDSKRINIITPGNPKNYKIIISLIDDDIKLSYLSNPDYSFTDEEKIMILVSLVDRDKAIEIISDSFDDEFLIDQIINSKELGYFSRVQLSKALDNPKILLDNYLTPDFSKFPSECLEGNLKYIDDDDLIYEVLLGDSYLLTTNFDDIKDRIPDEYLCDILRSSNPYLLLMYINYIKEDDLVLKLLASITDSFSRFNFIVDDEKLKIDNRDELIQRISRLYNLDLDRLNTLIDCFGIDIIMSLKNDNIKEVFNLDDHQFENYLKIFNNSNTVMTKNNYDNLINVLLQINYLTSDSNANDIFTKMLYCIDKSDLEGLRLLVSKIMNKTNLNAELLSKGLDFGMFTAMVMLGDDVSISMLHEYSMEYILNCRNEYVQDNLIWEERKLLDRVLDFNKVIKSIFAYDSTDSILSSISRMYTGTRDPEIKELFDNKDLMRRLIEFKKDPENYILSKEDKSQLRTFQTILKKAYNYGAFEHLTFDHFSIPCEYDIVDQRGKSILPFCKSINTELLSSSLLNNDYLVNILCNYLSNFKMFGWDDSIINYFAKSGMFINDEIVKYFINEFASIYPELLDQKLKNTDNSNESNRDLLEGTRNLPLISVLNGIGPNLPMFKNYIDLIGLENFKLYFNDLGPNSSTLSKAEKLDELVPYVKRMYTKNACAIPPLKQSVSLDENKKLKVSVLSPMDPRNLVLGESTGACMRVGGAADSLLKCSIEHKNGFNIILENEDGKMVSRVTGFRIGNTIYLNQIRHSIDSNYSDDEVVYAVREFSNRLLASTDSSTYPIENVVVSDSMAMTHVNDKYQVDIPNGFKNELCESYGYLYSDVGSTTNRSILLATSRTDDFVISGGIDQTELYPIARNEPKFVSGEELVSGIKRIQLLNHLLNDNEIEDFNFEDCDYSFGYICDDFCIAVDSDGVKHTFVISSKTYDNDTVRAVDEYEHIIDIDIYTRK